MRVSRSIVGVAPNMVLPLGIAIVASRPRLVWCVALAQAAWGSRVVIRKMQSLQHVIKIARKDPHDKIITPGEMFPPTVEQRPRSI